MLDISYGYYLISLFILTGIIILLLDVKTHSTNNQKKEKKVTLFFGMGKYCPWFRFLYRKLDLPEMVLVTKLGFLTFFPNS